jgi:hypothetical protein
MWLKNARLPDVQPLTLLLVSLSALSARLAITEPGTAWYWPLLIIVCYGVGAVLLAALDRRVGWFSQPSHGTFTLSRIGILLGTLLLGVPFAEGAARILSTTYFRPLEQVTVVALTNFAFFAVAMSRVRRSSAAAAGVSFVLLLSAMMLGEHPAIVPLTAAYGGLSVMWLATRYWRTLSAATRNGDASGIPMIPVLCLMLLLAGITAASTRFAHGVPSIWGEWMPSSGGSRWANPAALLGIGDGDWMVSGPNAKSTGPIDSEYFLESDLPTLYDAITESYGEPRPPEEVQRAIFVKQEQILNRQGHKAPDVGAPGRQFSVYRKGRSQREPSASDSTNALLYVQGPTPVHLAMNVYDRFDGVNWHEPPEKNTTCRLSVRDTDATWLWFSRGHFDGILGDTRQHQLRFGRLSTERLPLPNHLERLRLGRHDSDNVQRWATDVLTWAHDGILRARRCLPTGIYLEVASHTICPSRLHWSDDAGGDGQRDEPSLDVPDRLSASAQALADRFAHLPRGWTQIHAVLDHLRTHYEHDRDATIPPTCSDPIHHFLHQARGGPSYQFVTAATLALRSLGYPTRVVSGFYASPQDYVARAGNTPVHVDDVHFWIELRTVTGDWITLDPTPGYLTEWYEPSWLERMGAIAATFWRPFVTNPAMSLVGAIVSIWMWWRRWWLRERLLTLWCLWWPIRDPEQRLADTLQLLDLRSRLSGHPRSPASTPRVWYRHADEPACREFVLRFYEAMYGGAHRSAGLSAAEVTRTCRAAVRATPVRILRERMIRA